MNLPGFNELSDQIYADGEPFIGGTLLRHTFKQARIVCVTCGELPAEGMMGWSSDWTTLCQQAMCHVESTGHTVVPDLTLRSVYGARS